MRGMRYRIHTSSSGGGGGGGGGGNVIDDDSERIEKCLKRLGGPAESVDTTALEADRV